MMETNVQHPEKSSAPRSSRFDPVALAALIGVVLMLTISAINLWNLERLGERVGTIEAAMDSRRPTGPDAKRIYRVKTEGAAAKGPETAQVTIVEFSDFQCPFCARVVPTFKQVESTYAGKVRLVWKHLPLPIHKDAVNASMAAEAARKQGKFWEFHDLLFANQSKLAPDDLMQYARALQLDMSRFQSDLLNSEEKERIEADVAEAAALGIQGTPSFFINGRFIAGALPFEAFAAVIDEELAKGKGQGAP